MEIVGGNQRTRARLSSPGMDIWLESRPFQGSAGGDLHYFSMCGSGRVTRLAVADVSGHGPAIDATARWLRGLMRKYINLLDQTQFARAINREFTQRFDDGSFATVLLATYFAPTDHLIVCNAGHPRPLWYSRVLGEWQRLDRNVRDPGPSIREARGTYRLARVANLPLGIIQPTAYYQFAVKLAPGDMVLLFTDGLTEARNAAGAVLGEPGLLDLAREIPPSEPSRFGAALLDRIEAWRGGTASQDDETLIVLHHNASESPPMTLGQALRSLAKMLGLRRV